MNDSASSTKGKEIAPITICIPVFNREEIVKRTLESVKAQTYRPLRVILVDNNSSDGTLSTLQEWKEANQAENFMIDVLVQPIPGACAARNLALDNVESDWTLFFDSDDTMPSNHIETIVDFINSPRGRKADVIGWSRRIHFQDGTSVEKSFTTRNPLFNNIAHASFATQGYLAKTELFRKAGKWNKVLKRGQDIELGNRLLRLKPKLAFIENHYVDVFDQPESISNKQSVHSLIESFEIIRSNFPNKKRHWVDLQILLRVALAERKRGVSIGYKHEIFARVHSWRKMLFYCYYRYQKAGFRGASRIYELTHFYNMC